MDPRRLSGHVALVTGAASGIGAATAAQLARDGAAVLATDRDEAVADVAARLRDDGLEVAWRLLDVTDEEAWRGSVGTARSSLGPLTILASDAGRYITGAELVVDGGYTAR